MAARSVHASSHVPNQQVFRSPLAPAVQVSMRMPCWIAAVDVGKQLSNCAGAIMEVILSGDDSPERGYWVPKSPELVPLGGDIAAVDGVACLSCCAIWR